MRQGGQSNRPSEACWRGESRWRIVTALACVALLLGCKSTRYHLDVLEEIHDDDYRLRNRVAVDTPLERMSASFVAVITGDRPAPTPIPVENPGMLCQRTIRALGSNPARTDAEYARAISLLTPVAELAENPMSRMLALDLMVFQFTKRARPDLAADAIDADPAGVSAEVDRLDESLIEWSELRSRGESTLEAEARCRESFRRLAGFEYSSWREAATVLRLFAAFAPLPGYATFDAELAGGIHRVAPLAIRLVIADVVTSRDQPDFVREEAAEGAGLLGDRDLVSVLNRVVSDDRSEAVRRRAAQALGRLGDGVAVPVLIDALELDADRGVRYHVEVALRRITGVDHGDDVAAWRAWWREAGREGEGGAP